MKCGPPRTSHTTHHQPKTAAATRTKKTNELPAPQTDTTPAQQKRTETPAPTRPQHAHTHSIEQNRPPTAKPIVLWPGAQNISYLSESPILNFRLRPICYELPVAKKIVPPPIRLNVYSVASLECMTSLFLYRDMRVGLRAVLAWRIDLSLLQH